MAGEVLRELTLTPFQRRSAQALRAELAPHLAQAGKLRSEIASLSHRLAQAEHAVAELGRSWMRLALEEHGVQVPEVWPNDLKGSLSEDGSTLCMRGPPELRAVLEQAGPVEP